MQVKMTLSAAVVMGLFLYAPNAFGYKERCREYFRSQFGQDEHFLEILEHAKDVISPYYIDLAANNHETLSNTYLLDKCLGWKGMCIEPHPQYYTGLMLHRKCDVWPICISDRMETVSFVLAGVLSGIESTNKNLEGTAEWQQSVNTETPRKEMQCVPLGFLLERSDVNKVGYLSLDVEGHELKILQGIDWEAVEIDVIAMEPNDEDAVDFLTKVDST